MNQVPSAFALGQALRLLCTVAGLVVVGCAPLAPISTFGEVAAPTPRVAILWSADNEASRVTTESFVENVRLPTAVFQLGEKWQAASLIAGLKKFDPALIVALGGGAVAFTQRYDLERPVLTGLAARDEARAGDAGVGLELPARYEFMMYKLVLPSLSRVATIYVPESSGALLTHVGQSLAAIDLTLVPRIYREDVSFEEQVARALSDADALWFFAAPKVLTTENFQHARAAALAAGKPLLCSTFAAFANAGAFIAIGIDYRNVGSQLAAQTRLVISGERAVGDVGWHPPAGGHVVVNEDVAARLGVQVPASVRPLLTATTKPRTRAP